MVGVYAFLLLALWAIYLGFRMFESNIDTGKIVLCGAVFFLMPPVAIIMMYYYLWVENID